MQTVIRFVFTTLGSQIIVNAFKRAFWQRFDIWNFEFVIVHLQSRSYNVPLFWHWVNWKITNQWRFRIAHNLVQNQVSVFHDRVFVCNFVRQLGLVRLSFCQHYFNFFTNVSAKYVFPVRTKQGKISSYTFYSPIEKTVFFFVETHMKTPCMYGLLHC